MSLIEKQLAIRIENNNIIKILNPFRMIKDLFV